MNENSMTRDEAIRILADAGGLPEDKVRFVWEKAVEFDCDRHRDALTRITAVVGHEPLCAPEKWDDCNGDCEAKAIALEALK